MSRKKKRLKRSGIAIIRNRVAARSRALYLALPTSASGGETLIERLFRPGKIFPQYVSASRSKEAQAWNMALSVMLCTTGRGFATNNELNVG